ncbi:hypothetical protein V8017_04195 [Stenotrophomonas rhizophila]
MATRGVMAINQEAIVVAAPRAANAGRSTGDVAALALVRRSINVRDAGAHGPSTSAI